MGKSRVLPDLGQQVVGIEAEQLWARSRGIGEMSLEVQPPLIRYVGGGEGKKVAGLEIVALSLRGPLLANLVEYLTSSLPYLPRISVEQVPIATFTAIPITMARARNGRLRYSTGR